MRLTKRRTTKPLLLRLLVTLLALHLGRPFRPKKRSTRPKRSPRRARGGGEAGVGAGLQAERAVEMQMRPRSHPLTIVVVMATASGGVVVVNDAESGDRLDHGGDADGCGRLPKAAMVGALGEDKTRRLLPQQPLLQPLQNWTLLSGRSRPRNREPNPRPDPQSDGQHQPLPHRRRPLPSSSRAQPRRRPPRESGRAAMPEAKVRLPLRRQSVLRTKPLQTRTKRTSRSRLPRKVGAVVVAAAAGTGTGAGNAITGRTTLARAEQKTTSATPRNRQRGQRHQRQQRPRQTMTTTTRSPTWGQNTNSRSKALWSCQKCALLWQSPPRSPSVILPWRASTKWQRSPPRTSLLRATRKRTRTKRRTRQNKRRKARRMWGRQRTSLAMPRVVLKRAQSTKERRKNKKRRRKQERPLSKSPTKIRRRQSKEKKTRKCMWQSRISRQRTRRGCSSSYATCTRARTQRNLERSTRSWRNMRAQSWSCTSRCARSTAKSPLTSLQPLALGPHAEAASVVAHDADKRTRGAGVGAPAAGDTEEAATTRRAGDGRMTDAVVVERVAGEVRGRHVEERMPDGTTAAAERLEEANTGTANKGEAVRRLPRTAPAARMRPQTAAQARRTTTAAVAVAPRSSVPSVLTVLVMQVLLPLPTAMVKPRKVLLLTRVESPRRRPVPVAKLPAPLQPRHQRGLPPRRRPP
mmetsp:Transcript_57863/g.150793  ORF Transcript_57863/g.150793 Transcript_57863/m.150793 type:complete len:692 (-) Transcript_57863:38-2113(-)